MCTMNHRVFRFHSFCMLVFLKSKQKKKKKNGIGSILSFCHKPTHVFPLFRVIYCDKLLVLKDQYNLERIKIHNEGILHKRTTRLLLFSSQ